jgi:DNA processing protein
MKKAQPLSPVPSAAALRWHRLKLFGGITVKAARSLCAASADGSILEADDATLLAAGFPSEQLAAWRQFAAEHTDEAILSNFSAHGVAMVALSDEQYLPLLAAISDPPPVLYYRGTLPKADAVCLGLVGSRKPTAYGKVVASRLAEDIARSGVTVVSGLAYGIDTLAHEGALVGGGLTIAVLGSGLDEESIYPSHNLPLTRSIIEHGGCLLSEYPPGTPPYKQHFIARNRIIAGLSQGVVVVEAVDGSGALITTDFTVSENRDVFAVPGPITSPESFGPNTLLKTGAHVVTTAEDVLSIYNVALKAVVKSTAPVSADEQAVLEYLQHGPQTFEHIVHATQLATHIVSASLVSLELHGRVQQHNSLYTRIA